MTTSPLQGDEGERIAQAIAGDARAIRALYETHRVAVYSTIRRLVDDPALADDASQETWVRAFRKLSDFRGRSAFSLWLHRIAVNSALNARRSLARQANREIALLDSHSIEPAQHDRAERRDLREQLEAALRRLPPGMRAVIVLHDIEGYTHQEIGGLLDISPGTSKSQLFKARVQLRRLLTHVSTEPQDVTSQ